MGNCSGPWAPAAATTGLMDNLAWPEALHVGPKGSGTVLSVPKCSSVFSYSKEETDCLGPSHVHNIKEIEEFIKALPG